uniref:Uncharacterized protein n=1 Tax=Rhodnius prolixus TaxID=13249 RepID=T1ICB9_RHOPR
MAAPHHTQQVKKSTDNKTKIPKETRAAKGSSDELPVKREVQEVEDDDSVLDVPLGLNLPIKSEDSGQSSEVISNDDVRSTSKTSNNSTSNDGDITSAKINLPVITATCSLANQLTTISNHPSDEYSLLGEEVATRVRQLPTTFARCLVRYKIQQLLFEAAMGQYDHPTPAYILPETLDLNENSGSSSCSLAEDMFTPGVPTRFTCRY